MNKSEKQKSIVDVLNITKDAYIRNYNNLDRIDKKIEIFFTIITGIFLYFISSINYNTDLISSIQFSLILSSGNLFIIILIVFILIYFLLFKAYFPISYSAIDTNKLINKFYNGGYNQNYDLLCSITGTISDSIISLKKAARTKSKLIKLAAFCLLKLIILIIILKIKVGV